MAILSATELAELRRRSVDELGDIDFPKATINVAFQAIEDWFEANKASGVTAINAATAPYTFTNAEKKILFQYWLLQKFNREAAT